MTIELVHLTATATMTGLIWFVQIVHYPLFALVGDGFPSYQRAHERLTTVVVLPLMGTELVTAILLFSTNGASRSSLPANGLLVLIWLSTLFIQMPCHRRLESGFDSTVHQRLVRTNWFRTLAWSARSVLLLVLLAR